MTIEGLPISIEVSEPWPEHELIQALILGPAKLKENPRYYIAQDMSRKRLLLVGPRYVGDHLENLVEGVQRSMSVNMAILQEVRYREDGSLDTEGVSFHWVGVARRTSKGA